MTADRPDLQLGVADEQPESAAPRLDDGDALTAAQVRGRSLRGVVTVALRGLGVRMIGLLTSVVLARLLVPSEFGLLAFGTTLIVVGAFLTDAGLAAQLLRAPQAPTRRQLRAVLGLQLAVTVVVVGVATAALVPRGTGGQVTAVMLWSLVPATFRVPATVQLERELRFGAVAIAEVLETVVYAVVAVVLVVLGAGVWGVAAATVVRAFVGATVLQRVAPQRVLRPSVDWTSVAPLLAFGLLFQLNSVLGLVREQGINLVTAGLGGTALLGYWSLGQRVLLVPFLLFETLWRVAFPSVARLLEAGHDVRADLSRSLTLGAFLTGLVTVPLSVSAPLLVPFAFGDQWSPVVPLVPLACAGLVLSGPVSAVGVGFLAATGRVRLVALAQGLTIVPWAVLLPVLIPRIGVTGHGVAWAVACLVDAAVLAWALDRYAAVSVLRTAVPAALCAVLVSAGGFALTVDASTGALRDLTVVALCWVGYLALAPLVARGALTDLRRIATQVRGRQDVAA